MFARHKWWILVVHFDLGVQIYKSYSMYRSEAIACQFFITFSHAFVHWNAYWRKCGGFLERILQSFMTCSIPHFPKHPKTTSGIAFFVGRNIESEGLLLKQLPRREESLHCLRYEPEDPTRICVIIIDDRSRDTDTHTNTQRLIEENIFPCHIQPAKATTKMKNDRQA